VGNWLIIGAAVAALALIFTWNLRRRSRVYAE
jgi:hypothetical protein